jgi:hypothetical protein
MEGVSRFGKSIVRVLGIPRHLDKPGPAQIRQVAGDERLREL